MAVIVKMTGYRSRESGMIDFQAALKAAQNLIAPLDYYSFHSRLTAIRKIKKTGGTRWRSASHFAAFIFYLEGVSEAEISL